MRVDVALDLAHMRLVEGEIDLEQRRSLQLDAAAPALARLGENRPADRRLRPDAVDMGAHRAGAVGVGAAEGELHARGDVRRAPTGASIGGDPIERGGEGAVRVGGARPDLALVDMGMGVDEQRQNDPAAKWKTGNVLHPCAGARARGGDGADAILLDQKIDPGEAFAVDLADLPGEQGAGNFGVRKEVARRAGDGVTAAHFTARGRARCRANGAAADARRRSARDRS